LWLEGTKKASQGLLTESDQNDLINQGVAAGTVRELARLQIRTKLKNIETARVRNMATSGRVSELSLAKRRTAFEIASEGFAKTLEGEDLESALWRESARLKVQRPDKIEAIQQGARLRASDTESVAQGLLAFKEAKAAQQLHLYADAKTLAFYNTIEADMREGGSIENTLQGLDTDFNQGVTRASAGRITDKSLKEALGVSPGGNAATDVSGIRQDFNESYRQHLRAGRGAAWAREKALEGIKEATVAVVPGVVTSSRSMPAEWQPKHAEWLKANVLDAVAVASGKDPERLKTVVTPEGELRIMDGVNTLNVTSMDSVMRVYNEDNPTPAMVRAQARQKNLDNQQAAAEQMRARFTFLPGESTDDVFFPQ